MDRDLSSFVALVTGGTSGIGFEMSKQLLSLGASVIIAARAGKRMDDALEKLSPFGKVYAVEMDVQSEESVSKALDWTKEHFDHLDLLVNNAGIGRNAPGMESLAEDHKFYEIPVSAVKATIDTNLLGFFIVTSKFIPLMLKKGCGRILYVSTSTGTMTKPKSIPYGPSKAGADAMAMIMAKELSDTNITVNVICPGGFTDTPMSGDDRALKMRREGKLVLEPTVLNRVISFFASDAAKGVNGEHIIGIDFDSWLKEKGIDF